MKEWIVPLNHEKRHVSKELFSQANGFIRRTKDITNLERRRWGFRRGGDPCGRTYVGRRLDVGREKILGLGCHWCS